MRISDWSSDVCSSDLTRIPLDGAAMFIDQIDSLTPSGVSSHTNNLVLGIPGDPEPDVVAREHHALVARDRKSAGEGKRVSVREDLGGGGGIKKKKNKVSVILFSITIQPRKYHK